MATDDKTSSSPSVDGKDAPLEMDNMKAADAKDPHKIVDNAEETPLATASYYSRMTFRWMHSVMRVGFKRPLEPTDLPRMDHDRQANVLVEQLMANIEKRQKQREEKNANVGNPPLFRQARWAVRSVTHTKLPKDFSSFGPGETVQQRFQTQHAEWTQRSGKRGGGIMLALAVLDTFPRVWTAIPYKIIADACMSVTPLLTKAIIRFSQQEYAARHGQTTDAPNMGRGIGLAIGLFLLYLLQAFTEGQFSFIVQHEGLMAKAALSQALYSNAFHHSVEARAQHPTGKLITHLSADLMRVSMASRYVILMLVTPVELVTALVLLCIQIGVSGIIGFIVIVLASPVQAWLTKRIFQQRRKSTEFTESRNKLLGELLSAMATVKMFTYELPFLSRLGKIRQSELEGVRNIQMLRAMSDAIMFSLPLLGSVFAFIMYSALHPHMDIANLFTAVTYFGILQSPLTALPMALTALADVANALQRVSTVFDAGKRADAEPIDAALDVAIKVHGSFQWEQQPQNDAKPFAIRDLNMEIPRGQLAAIIGPVGSGKSSILQGILGEMKRADGYCKLGGRVAYCQQSAWIQNATLRENILFGQPWDEDRYWRCIRQASMSRDLEILPDGDSTEIGEKGINLSGGQKQRVAIARALYFDTDIYLLDDPLSALDTHVGKAVFNDAIMELRRNGKTVLLVTHAVHFLPQVDYIYSIESGSIVKQGTYSDLSSSFNFSDSSSEEEEIEAVETVVNATASNGKGRLTVAEERITGAVGPRVYAAYIRAGGIMWLAPLILTTICMQASQLMSSVWLVYWEGNRFYRVSSFYQGIYALLGMIAAAFTCFTGVSLALLSLNASRRLFKKALQHIFFSPMSFFDTTPLGRIQGIFSTDMTAIDNAVPEAVRYTLIVVANLVGSIIIISISFPYFVAIVAVVGACYGLFVFYYRRFAREVKRIDAMNRSLLFSHFSESLTGLPTIRAYGKTKEFVESNAELVDRQNRATLLSNSGMNWLQVRLESMGSLLILAVGLMCTAGGGSINPGQVALALTYMVQTTQMLGTLAFVGTMLETSMNGVERILFYTDGRLPQEEAYEKETDPTHWPSAGAITMDKLVMSYRPGQPIVLKGISLDIKSGQKVGIVGRTGAGKSSISVALYRIAELLSGAITIDGVDISSVGLRTLRSKLAIIPQDPVLFSGTLRTNLDPFDQYADAALHDALERASLKFALDMPIDAGGANLSVGERSLVSLARALVRNSQIMVLDEATASVDIATDAEIQRAIRECHNKTILCIAHRLQTIISWDVILVLEAGEVVEFASPLELFDKGGTFRSMCDESRIGREDIVNARASM